MQTVTPELAMSPECTELPPSTNPVEKTYGPQAGAGREISLCRTDYRDSPRAVTGQISIRLSPATT